MTQFDLTGKIALVTGASYGIGFAIAKGLASAGAKIVFNDINQDMVNKGIAAYAEEGIQANGYVATALVPVILQPRKLLRCANYRPMVHVILSTSSSLPKLLQPAGEIPKIWLVRQYSWHHLLQIS